MSLLVKICGLSTRETLDAALDAGADMVGFVFFPPSPRHVSLEAARELGRHAKGRALKVALTVDADDATFENIIETLRPDLLQLHGRETVGRIRDIKQRTGLPVMKAIAVETAGDLAAVAGYAAVSTASCSMRGRRRTPRVRAASAPSSTGVSWRISRSTGRSWSPAD
jgi:phosphoribosylanthranilate isomerase